MVHMHCDRNFCQSSNFPPNPYKYIFFAKEDYCLQISLQAHLVGILVISILLSDFSKGNNILFSFFGYSHEWAAPYSPEILSKSFLYKCGHMNFILVTLELLYKWLSFRLQQEPLLIFFAHRMCSLLHECPKIGSWCPGTFGTSDFLHSMDSL